MLVYATSEEYEKFVGTPAPTGAARMLRSASLLVREFTKTATYSTDDDGYPSDDTIRAAFRDAACAQLVAWQGAGIDPAGLGLSSTGVVSSKSLDGASVSYDTSLNASVTAFQARQALASQLAPEAVLILGQALPYLNQPWVCG